jgi:uncharacterized protein (TIGR03118 family)
MNSFWMFSRHLAVPALASLLAWDNVAAVPAYRVHALVANKAHYNPDILDPTLVNAWGLANRPAGFGGHIWVANYGNGTSDEYVGDVGGVPLHQDNLKIVTVPGSIPGEAGPSGVVFNQFSSFVVTQAHANGPITAPAKFLFCTDSGVVSAWTERARPDGSFDRPGEAVTAIDRSAQGSAFFGLALDADGSRLYVADFGLPAGIRVYDAAFRDTTPADSFLNPWAIPRDGKNLITKPGLLTPFNIQTIELNGQSSLFVPYIHTKAQDDRRWVLERAEEDAGPGKGRLAEFDFNGQLRARWLDRGLLNAPWGVAVAPPGFGSYTGSLLVGNFGDGTIAVFNPVNRTAVDYLRDNTGQPIQIDGLWALLPGNGASLGESFRVYFAAGPDGEQDGIFGYVELEPAAVLR